MATTLQIRDLDDHVHAALTRRARAHRRSLAAEAAMILEAAVSSGTENRARRAALLEALGERADAWPAELPDIEALIHEDRAR